MKIILAISSKVNDGKKYGGRQFQCPQQLSDTVKCLSSLCPSALPPSVGWHIVSSYKMAAAATGITSSHNCISWQKEGSRVPFLT